MKPDKINILGIIYKIEYTNKPSEVDIFKRESLWGQIDFWTRTIRVYDNGQGIEDIWQTIFHEILHGIVEQLKLKSFDSNKSDEIHDDLDVLALGIIDVLTRNGWFRPTEDDIKAL